MNEDKKKQLIIKGDTDSGEYEISEGKLVEDPSISEAEVEVEQRFPVFGL